MDPKTAEPFEEEPEVMNPDGDDNPEFEDQPDNREDPREESGVQTSSYTDSMDDLEAEPSTGVRDDATLQGGDPAVEKGPLVEDVPDNEDEIKSGPRM